MDRFSKIDNKLKEFAAKCNGELHTSGSWIYGVPPDKIEERRITWIDEELKKVIHILPHFETEDFDAPLWCFENFACPLNNKPESNNIPFWQKDLLDRVEFSKIEDNIDELLTQSFENLQSISMQDLKIHRNKNFSMDVIEEEVDE